MALYTGESDTAILIRLWYFIMKMKLAVIQTDIFKKTFNNLYFIRCTNFCAIIFKC